MSAESGEGKPARVGSVPYLNAAPLVHGLGSEVRLAPPSQLAKWLREGTVDAGLVSLSEVLEHDLYDVVDGVGVVSDGPVYSVFLAHHGSLEGMRRVACDPASLTSVRLLQWLLASRGVHPEFVRWEGSAPPGLDTVDGFLLIGDPAIAFRQSSAARTGGIHIWDLGEAWREATGLPFVYAAWAVRRDRVTETLVRQLHAAGIRGCNALEEIIRTRPEFDASIREKYLRHHIRHRIGPRERLGVARFAEGLESLGIAHTYPVRWLAVDAGSSTAAE